LCIMNETSLVYAHTTSSFLWATHSVLFKRLSTSGTSGVKKLVHVRFRSGPGHSMENSIEAERALWSCSHSRCERIPRGAEQLTQALSAVLSALVLQCRALFWATFFFKIFWSQVHCFTSSGKGLHDTPQCAAQPDSHTRQATAICKFN
jgi:hypothetical protein